MLNYIAKLQNLKAIHNILIVIAIEILAELYRKITKFESNSQRPTAWRAYERAELYRKITKFESNSQHVSARSKFLRAELYRKITKFESNSQLNSQDIKMNMS